MNRGALKQKQLMLRDKILNKETGLIFYSLTPPKINTDFEKVKEIAKKHVERLKDLSIDGLLLYDIQDESSRTEKERTVWYFRAEISI